MKEQLITFKTAKLAEEKGFDLGCQNFFTTSKKEISLHSYVTEVSEFWTTKERKIRRPSQSTLQKWLREKYEIEVNPYRVSTIDEDITYVVTVKNYKDNYWGQPKFINTKNGEPINHYKNYEDAFENGLKEALKIKLK